MNARTLLASILGLILAAPAFAVLTRPNGATDVTVYFFVTDPNGDPNTSIALTDLDLYYIEQGQAMAAKVDVTALAAADSAHSDNKAFDCGQGVLRVDWPDAAFDGGIGKTVELIVRDVTGATDDGHKDVIFPITVQLGAVADVRYANGATDLVTNLVNTFVTAYATAFDDTNDVFNSRLTKVSKAAQVMTNTDMLAAVQAGMDEQGYTEPRAQYLAAIPGLYDELGSETYGLSAMTASLGNISDELSDGTYGLSAIQTRIGAPAGASTIAGMLTLLQTDADSIDAIAAKLDTMLVASGDNFQFTTDAIENAPAATVDDWSGWFDAIGMTEEEYQDWMMQVSPTY